MVKDTTVLPYESSIFVSNVLISVAYGVQHTAYGTQHTAYSRQHTADSIQYTALAVSKEKKKKKKNNNNLISDRANEHNVLKRIEGPCHVL